MKHKRLGCLTTGGLVAFIISLITVGVSYAFTRYAMFSPGKLNSQSSGIVLSDVSSHADLEGDCAACHTAPWDTVDMADLCIDCHRNVIDQLQDENSLHGAVMANMSSLNCRECHTDHNGPAASMSEFLDGDFPHELVGFALQSHARLDWGREVVCADCHRNGFRSFELAVCIECHEFLDLSFMDVHISLFSASCLECHDGVETLGADFDHDLLVFPMLGKHAGLECGACHQGAETLVMLKNTPQNCEGCHLKDDAHQGVLGVQCAACHTPEGWRPALFDHSGTGFELVGGHADLACENCHVDATFQGADPNCISCHAEDEPHEGLFGTECTLCHSVFSWDDVHFDHSGDYAQDCIACHQSDSPANHYPGQCSVCHSTAAWTPASFSHTFPMDHGGAQQQCSLCHTSANYYQYTCYECHEHSPAEIRSEHEGIANLNNCIRCHWDGREHDDDGGGGDDGGNNDNND